MQTIAAVGSAMIGIAVALLLVGLLLLMSIPTYKLMTSDAPLVLKVGLAAATVGIGITGIFVAAASVVLGFIWHR